MTINALSLKTLKTVWGMLIALQFFFLILFFVIAELVSPSNLLVHLSISYTLVGFFVALLIIPLIVCFRLQKSFVFTAVILLLFNVLGSVGLYYRYKNEM